jgi:hypothetical protein
MSRPAGRERRRRGHRRAHRSGPHRRPDRRCRGAEDAAGEAHSSSSAASWWSRRWASSCWWCCWACGASLPLSEVLMVAISQMVSMVPEGLPVAMTIALAVGMQRMADRGAIIRRLSAVETLGSTTVICSDKTGTLTRNEMTAVALWLPGGRQIGVGGIGYVPQGASRRRKACGCGRPGAAGPAAGRRPVQRRGTAAARGRPGRLDGAGRPDRRCAAGAGAAKAGHCIEADAPRARRARPNCPSTPTPN